jgi:hypothetical protein
LFYFYSLKLYFAKNSQCPPVAENHIPISTNTSTESREMLVCQLILLYVLHMKIASLPEEETKMMASKNMEGEGREAGDILMDLH